MTPEQKPEWFQIADEDNAAAVRPVSKKLPVLALLAVLGILGVGAVMAQTQNEPPASATENMAPNPDAPAVGGGDPAAGVTIGKGSAGNESVAPPTMNIAPDKGAPQLNGAPPAGGGPANPQAPLPPKDGMKNPKIGVLPPAGGGDDDGVGPKHEHHNGSGEDDDENEGEDD